MLDDAKHEPGLPGAEIVGQFSDQIRKTIVGGVESATQDVVQRIIRWCIATIIVALVGAGAVTWLVLSLIQSKQSGVQFQVRYGDTTAVCARGPDTPDGTPVVICTRTLLAGHGLTRWGPSPSPVLDL